MYILFVCMYVRTRVSQKIKRTDCWTNTIYTPYWIEEKRLGDLNQFLFIHLCSKEGREK